MYTDSSNESSRPVTPSEEDCCHNSCDPCIFDVHTKLLEEYERKKKRNIRVQSKNNILCPVSYKNFIIIKDIKEVSECYILLSLKYQENDVRNHKSLLIGSGQHVMVNLGDVTRPLTPIFYTENTIEFLVRLYPNGKLSTYLKNIKIGDIIRIRGPYGNFKYKCNSFQNIIMFSMGSGITAMYPIVKSIVDNESDETKVHLIAGFRNRSDVPLKKELQNLTDYWNFKCTLHFSQLHNNICNLHGINLKCGRLDKESVTEILKGNVSETTLILICGTPQYNRSVEQWTSNLL